MSLQLCKLFWVQDGLLVLLVCVLPMHLVEWQEARRHRGLRQALRVVAVLGAGRGMLLGQLVRLCRLVVVIMMWQLGSNLVRRLDLPLERSVLASGILLSSRLLVRLL